MSFLKRKQKNNEGQMLQQSNRWDASLQSQAIPHQMVQIHPDLEGLIWIADGPNQNYFPNASVEHCTIGNYSLSVSFSGMEEPSLITLNLPVNGYTTVADKLPYYPFYREMIPEQRGQYWRFLQDPYNDQFEIG